MKDSLIKLEYNYQKDYKGMKKRNYFITEYRYPDNKGNYQNARVLCFCNFHFDHAKRIYNALIK